MQAPNISTTMQRKIYLLKSGNLRNLQQSTHNLPNPAADEVQVAIKAIGLNFADLFAIWGLYKAAPKEAFTPGLEYAGEVIAKGADVDQVQVGDRIMGVTKFGAYATHLNIDARYVTPIPTDWTYEEGASYLVQALTAYYGLKYLGQLESGQIVLIHSAAGGVGIWANRIAQKMGAYTIGTVGSASKLSLLEKEGYDKGLVRSSNFQADLKNALGQKPLNLVMECIGGKILKVSYEQLAPQGRMVVYGSARYSSNRDKPNIFSLLYKFLTRPKIDPQGMTNTNRAVLGFNLIYLYEQASLMAQLLEEMAALDLGRPVVGHTFSFDQLPEAIRLFRTGKTTGKVVVKV